MRAVCVVVCAMFLVWINASAGPLSPPAGPVASSPSPPGEIKPRINVNSLPGDANASFVISSPGSYYLTDNITLGGFVLAVIRSDANDVTLDLNGYWLAAGTTTPVIDASGVEGTRIMNGALSGFERVIVLNQGEVSNVRIFSTISPSIVATDSVIVDSAMKGATLDRCAMSNCAVIRTLVASDSVLNRIAGRFFDLTGCAVSECSTAETANATTSFVAIDSTLDRCVAAANANPVAFDLTNSTLERSIASGGAIHATGGVVASCLSIDSPAAGYQLSEAVARDCVSLDAAMQGFVLTGGAAAESCQAHRAILSGFECSNSSRATDCLARTNDVGFNIFDGSIAAGCFARENANAGFEVSDRSETRECTAIENAVAGFAIGLNSSVTDCRAILNGDGFVTDPLGVSIEVIDCYATASTGTGFLQGALALIARNRATGNATNYSLGFAGAMPVSAPGPGASAYDNLAY